VVQYLREPLQINDVEEVLMSDTLSLLQNETIPMTPNERHTLFECESVIEKHIQDFFYEVGKALMEINDRKLYREEYPTFAEYCKTRWNLERSRAYQIIKFYKIAENVDDRRHSEYTLRPLARFTPEQQREIYWKAFEQVPDGGKLTHNLIYEVIDSIQHSSKQLEVAQAQQRFERQQDRIRNEGLRSAFFDRSGAYDKKYFKGKRKPKALFFYLRWLEKREKDKIRTIVKEIKKFSVNPNDDEKRGELYDALLNQKFIRDFIDSPFMNDLIGMLEWLGLEVKKPEKIKTVTKNQI
jgi:hypothetical protein